MPTSITLNVWKFDPAFQYYTDMRPDDWVGAYYGGPDNNDKYAESGSPLDLGPTITSMTITDENSDDYITGGESDFFTIDGVRYYIDYVYNGDQIIVDGSPITLVTFYGSDPITDERVAVSLPLIDGVLRQAFPLIITGTDWITNPNDLALPISEIPCFTRGTFLDTANGPVTIENLHIGDIVATRDHGLQEIRWIGSRSLSAMQLSMNPKLFPIRISAGALGNGTPTRDLVVSPQHRILIKSKIARRMFGTDEVLVAAKQLLSLEGVNEISDAAEVEYFHVLFDNHEIIISNGAETESLFIGPQALASLGKKAIEEICAIFPEALGEGYAPVAARLFPKGQQGRKMAERHRANAVPLH